MTSVKIIGKRWWAVSIIVLLLVLGICLLVVFNSAKVPERQSVANVNFSGKWGAQGQGGGFFLLLKQEANSLKGWHCLEVSQDGQLQSDSQLNAGRPSLVGAVHGNTAEVGYRGEHGESGLALLTMENRQLFWKVRQEEAGGQQEDAGQIERNLFPDCDMLLPDIEPASGYWATHLKGDPAKFDLAQKYFQIGQKLEEKKRNSKQSN